MSERKQNLSVAWSVWLDAATTALTRAREDRLGCRIDVPARGGDAVCELLDGAEVIGRYVAMGVQPALPLGEAKADAPSSQVRCRYGFRPDELVFLTDDELDDLDGWFPGGFVQVHLPRTDPAVWWHTQYTEPSATSRTFLEWSATSFRAGVPVTGVNAEEQRAIDAAAVGVSVLSASHLARRARAARASAPTGFQHATAETPQEPAPVETATSKGFQAVADAASRAPVGDPTSALGELLAAAEGTPGDAEAFAPLERITLRDAATQAREAREATKPATTKGRDAKPENVSEKAPKGDVVRVIVTPTDEALGGFKGFRWLDVTRGLHGWNAMKTPTAGGLSGGTCRPLELHVAPPGPDVKTLIERLTKKKVPFLDFGNVPRAKEFDFAPSRRPIREKWNAAHPNHPVVLDGPLGAHGPTWEKPARTKRPNLATPPPEADAQRAEEFASIVQEGFVRPVIAREAWEKLTDEARGAFAVFRLGSGSHVRTSWGPTKDGKGVEPLLPPIGRRSEIALNLEEIAAELGVTLTFEPHPVMGIPAPDAPSSSGAPDDAPAAPAKLHRQTPEPAADKRAGRGRHTILAQDASGAWTFKRERHGETGPAWRDVATNLAASGKRVRVYDGKPRCTWDSLDEPVPQFEQPAPEPAQAPASPELVTTRPRPARCGCGSPRTSGRPCTRTTARRSSTRTSTSSPCGRAATSTSRRRWTRAASRRSRGSSRPASST